MQRRVSNFLKILLVLLLIPVLLIGLVQTPPGKALLAKVVSNLLSRSENLNVQIGTITGWIPGDVYVTELKIGDAQGVWLSAENLHCRWMIRDLKDERIRYQELSANVLEWHRFPEIHASKYKEKRKREGFDLVEVILDGLNIDELRLGKELAGIPLNYSVQSGGISLLTTGRLSGELRVEGDAVGWVGFDAVLAGNGQNKLNVQARLDRMNEPDFGLDVLSGEGEVAIDVSGVIGQVEARIAKGAFKGEVKTGLLVSGRKLRFEKFHINTGDLSAHGNLALDFIKKGVDISLESAELDARSHSILLDGNAVVEKTAEVWGVDVKNLNLRNGNVLELTLSGKANPEKVQLSGKLAAFDIGTTQVEQLSNFTGRVSGQLEVTGPLENPQIVAGIKVDGLASAQNALDELPELDFSIVGGVLNGELFGSTSLSNYASGFFSSSFAMPCSFSLSPFRYEPKPEELRGKLNANLDIGIFNNLAMFENQLIAGLIEADLSYEKNQPSGYLQLADGQYEHYDWGLVFHELQAMVNATPNGFMVERASGNDGYDGTLELTGGFGTSGLDMKLKVEGARLLQRPEVEARISGQLNLGGSAFHPQVAGQIGIDRAEILLDNIVASKPLVITDYDIGMSTNTVQRRAKKALPFGVDIQLNMQDQVYVVASLIDAVLGGTVQIRDTPSGISVRGTVEPRRGYVNFIGKKFRFVQEGEVVLDGSVPVSPTFNRLTAEYTRSDITARLVLNGRVNDPSFWLESSPALPQDEILSQILFSRDTSTISAYQAYQIAAAAQQLSGGLNGPGFMYQFRQAVGIDTLEWREAEAAGGGSSVAAGKYITPDLYVEINSSFDEEAETGMMAEYEVTRHFSVETSTGPKMRPGIGVNWKADY